MCVIYLFPTEQTFLCSHDALFPHLSVVGAPTQPTLEIPQAEEGMLMSPFGATAPNPSQLADEQLTRYMNDVQLDNEPEPFFFEEEFKYFFYKTPFFDDGHKFLKSTAITKMSIQAMEPSRSSRATCKSILSL